MFIFSKINIAIASYSFGITVFTYDLKDNRISKCCELSPKDIPDMYDPESNIKNTVFGLTSKGNFVYGGITPGNNRFREKYKQSIERLLKELPNLIRINEHKYRNSIFHNIL